MISDNEDIKPLKLSEQHYCFRLRFTEIGLLPGSYNLRGHSMDPEGVRLFDTSEMVFTVSGNTKEVGYIRLPHKWLDQD
jgi:lipopolysaccharide transport system ATP-binding protein